MQKIKRRGSGGWGGDGWVYTAGSGLVVEGQAIRGGRPGGGGRTRPVTFSELWDFSTQTLSFRASKFQWVPLLRKIYVSTFETFSQVVPWGDLLQKLLVVTEIGIFSKGTLLLLLRVQLHRPKLFCWNAEDLCALGISDFRGSRTPDLCQTVSGFCRERLSDFDAMDGWQVSMISVLNHNNVFKGSDGEHCLCFKFCEEVPRTF